MNISNMSAYGLQINLKLLGDIIAFVVTTAKANYAQVECQRRYEIVRKRRRNFVVFRRQGGDKIKRFLAQKECSQFAASGA